MSAQANLVINDGAGTPVAHTFNPKGAKTSQTGKDVALWRDQSPATMLDYLSITEQHSAPNSNGIEKFRWVIEVPKTETPSGATAPVKAYSATGVIEIWIHERASAAELANIAAFVKNFAAHAYMTSAVTNREAAW
jgi:hypothetical protein